MSNSEFLVTLNTLAGRSFEDLSAYPIYPRIMKTFNGNSFF
ncbi:MAG: hypothetical protein II303_03875, partial [Alistipes sp.]|nr:hypothetical protein [Alistipes sp.]